jgi:hypothetical protein
MVMKIRKAASLVVAVVVLTTTGCAYFRPTAPDRATLTQGDNGAVPPTGHTIESDTLSLLALPFFGNSSSSNP